mmetsp:Transcript_23013/g.50162  ORF Transcript_23013/g.50162 Transcript_23013/m.50162 type:complete len:465 (+) Transcript_23013:63-1457(+)
MKNRLAGSGYSVDSSEWGGPADPNISSAVMLSTDRIEPTVFDDIEDGKVDQGASWVTVGLLQVSDVLGAGMLAMGGAFAKLGWIPAFITSAIAMVLCVYLGLLQWECQNVYPSANSQRHLTLIAFRSRAFSGFVAFMLYGLLFVIEGAYLLSLATSLENLFVGVVDLCQWQWCLIACAMIFPTLLMRNLSALKYFVKASVTIITLAVLVISGFVIDQLVKGKAIEGTGTDVLFTALTMEEFFEGVAHICLAIMGLIVYLEMSAEMRDRSTFPKAFYISVPVEFGLFSLVGVVSYLYQGSSATNLLDVVPKTAPIQRVVNLLLFLYMLIAYLIKSVILTRAVHAELWPRSVDSNTKIATLQHFLIGLSLLIFALATANAIPIFNMIVTLCGSVYVPFLGYMLPVMNVVKTRFNTKAKIRIWEWVIWASVFIFFTLVTIIGTYLVVLKLTNYYSAKTYPFMCHPPQ